MTEVDLNAQIGFKLNTCPGDILADKPFLECANGGFTCDASLTYLSNIKGFVETLSEYWQRKWFLILPFIKLGVSGSVALNFEDAEDLKEHPMIGDKVGLKFSDVLGMMGIDKAAIESYETDLSGVDQSKLEGNE